MEVEESEETIELMLEPTEAVEPDFEVATDGVGAFETFKAGR